MTSETPAENSAAAGAGSVRENPSATQLADLQREAGLAQGWRRAAAAARTPPEGSPGRVPEPRTRDRMLWLWPLLGLVAVVAGGEVAGPLGSILAAVAGLVLLINFVGTPSLSSEVRLGVAIAAVVVGGAAILGSQYGVRWLSTGSGADAAVKSARADLRGKALDQSDLPASMAGADLVGSKFDRLDLTDRSLDSADARAASFLGATMIRTGLGDADLRGTTLAGARLRGADLRGSDLRGANLTGADLTDADLRGACLVGLDLTGVVLTRADATGAATTGVTVPRSVRLQAARWPAASTAAAACR